MDTLDTLSPPLPGETAARLTLSNGVILHYRRRPASGTRHGVVILLHGLASNLTRWSEFVEHTALQEHFDILRLDLRGHGDSFTRGRLGLREWSEDLLVLLDREGIDRAILVGHSLGAQVAIHFAGRHPSRVAGLVLIDPVFRGALTRYWRPVAWLLPLAWPLVWLIRGLNRLGLRRRHIPVRDLRRLDEITREKLLSRGKQEEMIARYSSPWPDLEYFPTANYLAEYLELLRAVPEPQAIPMPVVVMLSSGITFTDLDRMRGLVGRFPAGELVELPSYHWPLTEKPREVRAAIEEWVMRRFQ
ncbi:MAG: alpha/beta hydrolase [Pseudomonadota bacterium]